MTQSDYFELLGSPLHNTRWSWGSIRHDGTVFLRVWQDESRKHENSRYIRITNHEKFSNDQNNLGYQERVGHVELIRKGAKCIMIMCVADPDSLPQRVVKNFNSDEVFLGGKTIQLDGDTWIELGARVPFLTAKL